MMLRFGDRIRFGKKLASLVAKSRMEVAGTKNQTVLVGSI